MNLGIPAEKNPYRPDSASGKSVGLAHCRIGLVAFYFQPAPPHLGSDCLTLGLFYSVYFVLVKPWVNTPWLMATFLLSLDFRQEC